MSRYVVSRRPLTTKRIRMEWDDEHPLVPPLTVDECEPVKTGLLTAEGYAILRVNDPVGFHNPSEWS